MPSVQGACLDAHPTPCESDLDSIDHYSVCQQLRAIFQEWSGWRLSSSPESGEQPCWFCLSLLLFRDSLEATLMRAACCDAFLAAHNARRLAIAGTPAEHFEARLRVTARRHRALSDAWSGRSPEIVRTLTRRPNPGAGVATEALPERAPQTPRGRWVPPPSPAGFA